jgi:SAM-dependent methyltransferase
MPFEASKAAARRNFDRRFSTTYFVGKGIDIGSGPDPISRYHEFYPLMTEIKQWDQNDGDGMTLETIDDEAFDFVHSSHSLEHMDDPYVAMKNWIRVTKKGGHLIIILPDEDMFEQGVWPSEYTNGDHNNSWTIGKTESWSPVSINLTEFLQKYTTEVEILKIEKLDNTYSYDAPRQDQTRGIIQECAIEIILRKKTDEEIEKKGRLPKSQMISFNV